nr:MAG TPA: NTP-PPase-like protein [Caudoviricetes sp.]
MEKKIFNYETLNRLAKLAHERAVDKGFWDEERNNAHHVMLIICEMSEAVEAERKDRHADIPEGLEDFPEPAFIASFERHVKDTLQDEIADAVIRLLDLLSYLFGGEIVPKHRIDRTLSVYCILKEKKPLTLTLLSIITELSCMWSEGTLRRGVLESIISLEEMAEKMGFDLLRHIELKMRYNETRPRLHGKKY